jgi:hypothetical protein
MRHNNSFLPIIVPIQDERLYWTDMSGHAIRSSRLNGSDIKVVTTELQSPEGRAGAAWQ